MEESKRADEILSTASEVTDKTIKASSESINSILKDINKEREFLALSILYDRPIPASPKIDALLIRLLTPIAKDADKIFDLCHNYGMNHGGCLLTVIINRGMSLKFLGEKILMAKPREYPRMLVSLSSAVLFRALALEDSKEFALFIESLNPNLEIYFEGRKRKLINVILDNISKPVPDKVENISAPYRPIIFNKLIQFVLKNIESPLSEHEELELVNRLLLKLMFSKGNVELIDDFAVAFDNYQKRVYGHAYLEQLKFGDIISEKLYPTLEVIFFNNSMVPENRIKVLSPYLNPQVLSKLFRIENVDDLVLAMSSEHRRYRVGVNMITIKVKNLFNSDLNKIFNYWLKTRDEKINFMRRVFLTGGDAIAKHMPLLILGKTTDSFDYKDIKEFLSNCEVRIRSLEMLRILFPEEYLSEGLVAEIWPGEEVESQKYFLLEIKAAKLLYDLNVLAADSKKLNYGLHRLKIAMKVFEFVSYPEHMADISIIDTVLCALMRHPRKYEFGMAIGSQPQIIEILNDNHALKKTWQVFRGSATDKVDVPNSERLAYDVESHIRNELNVAIRKKRILLLRMLREKSEVYRHCVREARYTFLEFLADYTGYAHGFFTHMPGVPIPQLERPVSLDSEEGQAIVRMMQREIDRNVDNINLRAQRLRDREKLARIRGQKHTRKQELLPEVAGTLKFMV